MKALAVFSFFTLCATAGAAPRDSVYTDANFNSCKDKSYTVENGEASYRVNLWLCPGKGGYKVLVGGDEGWEWITLEDRARSIDFRELDLIPNQDNLAGAYLPAGTMEWRGYRVRDQLAVDSLIFRIASTEDHQTEKDNVLVVARLGAKPCIVGAVNARKVPQANVVARQLADRAQTLACIHKAIIRKK